MRNRPTVKSKNSSLLISIILLLTFGWGIFLYNKPLRDIETIVAHSFSQQRINIRQFLPEALDIADVRSPNSSVVAAKSIVVSSERKAITDVTGRDQLHIVFSTDCSPYQDWQSLLVFHSAHQVDQKGSITRIASGCSEEKKTSLQALYQELWGSIYNVHFTPGSRTVTSYLLSCNRNLQIF